MRNITFWAVGANFDGDDMSSEFINNSTWWDGWADSNDERNRNVLEKMNVGDVLIMKSSSTKGPGHLTTFTKLKTVGIIEERLKYYSFKVRWLIIKDLPKDFDGISYRKTIEPMREDEMFNYVKNIIEMDSIQGKVEILNYKKQIILQGPPGTGKTRLAKMIAKEMTRPSNSGSPMQIVEKFFVDFNDKSENSHYKKNEIGLKLELFTKRFPYEKLNELTLDDYCTGRGDRNNFCWWIETGLKALGKYSPGNSSHYLLYYSKSKGDFSKHGDLIKNIEDNNVAMKTLATFLHEVVVNQDFEKGSKFFGDSLLLKIFNSYYPDEYFPINGRDSLENALRIFNIESIGLNLAEKNKKLNSEFLKLKKKYNKEITAFDFMHFLFTTFNLKDGIKYDESQIIVNKGECKFLQFHPAYTYEDFVRGITAKTNATSQIEYKVENKSLSEFAERALDNPSANYVLIIDEINRANLPSVLGELIYALEYRFDPENPDETTVDSMYSIADPEGISENYEEGKKLRLPTNLYLIGTMNTADRSVGHIDYAIRRRFAFVDVLPTTEPLKPFALPYFKLVSELFVKNFDIINWNKPKLESSDYLATDFRPEDVWIGHSYFIADNEEQLKIKLKYEVQPILKEYLKDGILLDSAKDIIYGIS